MPKQTFHKPLVCLFSTLDIGNITPSNRPVYRIKLPPISSTHSAADHVSHSVMLILVKITYYWTCENWSVIDLKVTTIPLPASLRCVWYEAKYCSPKCEILLKYPIPTPGRGWLFQEVSGGRKDMKQSELPLYLSGSPIMWYFNGHWFILIGLTFRI